MDWARKHPLEAALGGVVALLLLIGIVSSLGSGSPSPTTAVPVAQETIGPSATVDSNSIERPDVDPVNCGPLITLEEVDDALGVTGQNVSFFQFTGGETCTQVMADDEELFVEIGPGAPSDFEPDAQVRGVSGEVVAGVGDDARWFTGVEGGVGVFSVRRLTSLGVLHYRVTLGRPGVEGSEQLEILRTLALTALPRFPGVEVEAPEPELIIFETEPIDLSSMGYVENLREKEKAGEWTLGEGLVATLKYFAGEIEAGPVLRDPNLVDNSGTGAMRLAREYLDLGADVEMQAEIDRLLELLVIPRDVLESLVGDTVPPLEVSLQPVSSGATAQESEECAKDWAGLACWEKVTDLDLDAMFGEDKYAVFHPVIPEGEDVAGWTMDDVFLTLDAMKAAAIKYETLGEMPTVDIVFRPLGNSNGFTLPHVGLKQGGNTCGINLNTPLQGLASDEFFQQWIAAAMAFCLVDENYEQIEGWWESGLVIYLSEWVFPTADFEHEKFPAALQQQEIHTTLLDRSQTNWAFFEDLHTDGGVGKSLSLIAHLQGSDLASYGGIENSFHNFERHLTDGLLFDIGGLSPNYSPDARKVTLSGPKMVTGEAPPFGVFRLHVSVPSGKVACVVYDEQGELRSSWRNGPPGSGSSGWTSDLRDQLKGESTFVVTATQPGGQFNVEVQKVADEDDGCEEEEEDSTSSACIDDLICDPSDYYTSALGQ